TPLADNYYRRLYRSSDPKRVVAREHTSLLDDRTRAAYEAGFKTGHHDPAAPNVLVATPTLEMGIDIGDLSSVMLASLPRSVAAYLQRVGRAGRLTGNSLNLAFVTGRGEHLPRLGDPLSLIDGPVRPPATYLSAEEILRRQYLAHLVDAFARDEDRPHPRTARAAIGSTEPGSFLGQLIDHAEANAPRLLATFLAQLPSVRADAEAELRRWATPTGGAGVGGAGVGGAGVGGAGSSGLAEQVSEASLRWQATVRGLQAREAAIQAALPELTARAESPATTEDDRRAARSANAALRQTGGALGALRGTYWVGVLEEYGLLPNYTLLDDSVTLDVSLSWLDPETQRYDSIVSTHKRGSAAALRDFAPGATFYAQGLQIEIDALDLGVDLSRIQPWSFCAACGYARHHVGGDDAARPCPRCGSGTITDVRQRLDVVEMTRVSAQAHRDEARINDRDDERRRARFTVIAAADIDPEGIGRQWFVEGYDFGARYLRRLTIRWLNLGPRAGFGTQREIAGHREPGNLFRVCAGCGVLDRAARANRPDEHRAWCRFRASAEEHIETVLLTRTLTTQGVVIPLPWSVSLGDSYAVPSLAAAVLLGLRELFGGSPDHIGVTATIDPVVGGDNREALLLHDLVPGGTGYLAELARPENVWAMLRKAWETVAGCSCAGEGRLACHRCLLPFAPRNRPDAVSRVAAERHLRAILTAGAGGEPPAEMAWDCTTQEPAPATSAESHLEQHFRSRFTAQVRELSGSITEEPSPYGNNLHVTISGGAGRTWLLEPQVTLPNARPDFLLRCTDVSVPAMAVFTDGYAYHAGAESVLA
ncbi:MAG TPA: Zn-binding domain-containing protein, partial [Candidatus Nanopelagicales bacterium]|nr:Zn-binding domain-containing protein [Candidatus Nanopelagicales bacterium]